MDLVTRANLQLFFRALSKHDVFNDRMSRREVLRRLDSQGFFEAHHSVLEVFLNLFILAPIEQLLYVNLATL